jgi:hypothetical protein
MNVQTKGRKRRQADKQQEKRSAKDRKRADRRKLKRQNEISAFAKELSEYTKGGDKHELV